MKKTLLVTVLLSMAPLYAMEQSSRSAQEQKRLDHKLFDATYNHHWATFWNKETDTARELLARGANPNATDGNGFSALYVACLYGEHSMAQLLIDSGADVNFSRRSSYSDRHYTDTPLFIAASTDGRRHRILEILLTAGANIEFNDQGTNIFHMLIHRYTSTWGTTGKENAQAVALLFLCAQELGLAERLLAMPDINGKTPLDRARDIKDIPTIELLNNLHKVKELYPDEAKLFATIREKIKK